jgi:hypothetical protein
MAMMMMGVESSAVKEESRWPPPPAPCLSLDIKYMAE